VSVLLVYVVIAVPPSLIALALVLAVLRADKKDLPAIIHGPSGKGPHDDEREENDGKGPPSLPKP
jgi:hypothetical protein